MKGAVKGFLRKQLRRVVVFKSGAFRITALDLFRRTPALRSEWSPFNLYLSWRQNQVQRLALDFFKGHPDLGDIFDSYYGKIDRIALAASFLQASLSLPGDVAEFGVYRGHTAKALDRTLERAGSDKRLFLFDSFCGMPEVSHPLDDAWEKGDLAYPVKEVEKLFKESPRINIVRGYFSDTLPQYPDLRFAFCHVDADLYTSVKECIAYIMPRLSPGGVIVFDDYGFPETVGAKAAIEEYSGQAGPAFIPLPTGQAVYLDRTGK